MYGAILDTIDHISTQAMDLVSKGKVDKDAVIQQAHDLQMLRAQMTKAVLETPTLSKTDAFIKILYAFKDAILPMLRPIGSFLLTVYFGDDAITTAANGDPSSLSMVLSGAFPAWMASRHVNKTQEKKAQRDIEIERARAAAIARVSKSEAEGFSLFKDQDW